MTQRPETSNRPERRTAGAFDVRTFIGGLLGFYGIVLTVTGIVSGNGNTSRQSASTDVNLNLVVGIALIIVGAAFLLWMRLRPTIVDQRAAATDQENPPDQSATPS